MVGNGGGVEVGVGEGCGVRVGAVAEGANVIVGVFVGSSTIPTLPGLGNFVGGMGVADSQLAINSAISNKMPVTIQRRIIGTPCSVDDK